MIEQQISVKVGQPSPQDSDDHKIAIVQRGTVIFTKASNYWLATMETNWIGQSGASPPELGKLLYESNIYIIITSHITSYFH